MMSGFSVQRAVCNPREDQISHIRAPLLSDVPQRCVGKNNSAGLHTDLEGLEPVRQERQTSTRVRPLYSYEVF